MTDVRPTTTVLVLRHGQSGGNVTHRLSSAPPGEPLTDEGRGQAARVAEALAGRHVARVYASPLRRAQQTAGVVAERLGAGEVVVLDGVREFELGDCEGSDRDDDWSRVDAVFDAWLDGRLDDALPGAESGRDVVERVDAALTQVVERHPGETVVVVSHGGAMSLALPVIATNAPDDRARGSGVPNCGIVELEARADGWRLVTWPRRVPQLGAAEHPGDLAGLVDRADGERNLPPTSGGAPDAVWAVVEGVPCAHLPVPFDWATQASLTALDGAPPEPVVDAVVAWLEEQSPGRWHLAVTESAVATVAPAAGLVERMRHGTWVCEEPPTVPSVDWLDQAPEVVAARDEAEFCSVFSAFGQGLEPVVAGWTDDPSRELVVVREGGRAVACARLHDLAGTTYVGGITVLPDERGRGWGRAVSALATRRALQRSPLAWLHCEDDVSGLYAHLGYRRVGTHVHLGPARSAGRS